MRLISTDPDDLRLRSFIGEDLPPYAILSHCWGDAEDEVTLQQFQAGTNCDSQGFHKILQACRIARSQDLDWLWVDTCCIDKTSSAELSEAINSMFAWYKRSAVCYAFLEELDMNVEFELPRIAIVDPARNTASNQDIPAAELTKTIVYVEQSRTEEPSKSEGSFKSAKAQHAVELRALTPNSISVFDGPSSSDLQPRHSTEHAQGILLTESSDLEKGLHQDVLNVHANERALPNTRWFTRGWTLQELMAPSRVHFYDHTLTMLGTREEFAAEISTIAGIDQEFLSGAQCIDHACVAQKMSWASARQTTRPEDIAYCLLGLFDLNLPLLYGEGGLKAFRRLQEAIIARSNDDSIFAWNNADRQRSGLIAQSPKNFSDSRCIRRAKPNHANGSYRMTNAGLELDINLTMGFSWTIALFNLQRLGAKLATLVGNESLRMTDRRSVFKELRLALSCQEATPLPFPKGEERASVVIHLRADHTFGYRLATQWYRDCSGDDITKVWLSTATLFRPENTSSAALSRRILIPTHCTKRHPPLYIVSHQAKTLGMKLILHTLTMTVLLLQAAYILAPLLCVLFLDPGSKSVNFSVPAILIIGSLLARPRGLYLSLMAIVALLVLVLSHERRKT